MPIFLQREARFRPDSPHLEPMSRWRWVGTVEAPTPSEALRVPLTRPMVHPHSELRVTSFLSWREELRERGRIARNKLNKGVDANV